ncbi:hypothetical protein [Tautonia plasticadhaerens]|uniref:Uncharacterized protein n=1 Tax=Tautonia plasticadhaerens TaxID=2527974 RepID=A0A518HDM6_9BACT|nr:hypothetical protein [Tautonia plasticadhaerens]QDV38958.1 hypothetical protein ElP_69180 [Tautonia plasticadhaerens]
MAHFQLVDNPFHLKRKWLFSKGARLFVKGDSGEERIAIHLGNRIVLEQKGAIGPGNAMPRIVPSVPSVVDVVETKVHASLQSQTITLKGAGAGRAVLRGVDEAGRLVPGLELVVVVGDFVNHPGLTIDLLADLCRGTDPVKSHAVHRMLHDNPENIFNENWQPIIDKWGERACGTVADDGASALWGGNATDHVFRGYHIAFRPGFKVTSRDQVKFSKAQVARGRTSIKSWLTRKKTPVVVGVLYGPTSSGSGAAASVRGPIETNRFGQLERTGRFGHSVLIVGCNEAADQFLYVDPWYNGSKLQYKGGFTHNEFPVSQSIGLFKLVDDSNRGPVLRQAPEAEGTFRLADGNILEITSGP